MLPAAATSAVSTPIDNCPICLEPLQSSEQRKTDVVVKPCNHVFHYGCLNRWLYSQPANTPSTCPLDRTNVTAIYTPATQSEIPADIFLERIDEMLVAAETGNLAKVAELLEQGIDVEAGNASEITPLQIAAQHYHFEIVDLLLSKGASDPETIYQLAMLLTTNKRICHDYVKARHYFKCAADSGNVDAQYYFAWFLNQIGGLRNHIQAKKYYKIAADNAHPRAMREYAEMCENGLGGDQNYREAATYYRALVVSGKDYFKFYLARMLTLTGSDEDMKEARKIYRQLANEGQGSSLNNYGVMLIKGLGGDIDLTQAREVFKSAIAMGNEYEDAHINLAIMLEEGVGGSIDISKAIELYQVAAKRGNTAAIERLLKLGLTPPEPD